MRWDFYQTQMKKSEDIDQSVKGMVSIVGAGPGDPELITVKGQKRIATAQVILYDYLLDEQLLAGAPSTCEIICVGKRSGLHSQEQSVINALLVRYAKQGKRVVRLKGGDPFIFGRGGEEVKTLRTQDIPFEVVPAVTSALGAAASLQNSLTHRERASSLIFATGHEDPEKGAPTIDWKHLHIPNSTLVLYMAMKHLPTIVEQLLKAGKSKDTPVAIVQWATMPQEQKLISTLDRVVDAIEQSEISSPAIVIIGRVLDLVHHDAS